ncbi:MAG: hypothetical protein IKP96_00925 [Elusimicrobiaceae bacterium]|nr:hypothetical protein [Elusimicrobiaceae bacterium]
MNKFFWMCGIFVCLWFISLIVGFLSYVIGPRESVTPGSGGMTNSFAVCVLLGPGCVSLAASLLVNVFIAWKFQAWFSFWVLYGPILGILALELAMAIYGYICG